ncbi:hypothetical protein N7445_010187 [Penicillium cf. griseofulvum]|nr:hypothetical protein N7445_010187 [Penicillium cf. griseofulvum]
MAPSFEIPTPVIPIVEDKITLKSLERTPLKPTGVLDAFESFDVTPVIGREFPNASLKDFLSAANSDDLLRELALTISQRGVVFFRKQGGLDNLQKELIQRLGELSGKPETSGLHVHPVVNSGLADKLPRHEWHSDIAFEAILSDYTLLRLTELPKTGAASKNPRFQSLYSSLTDWLDTLWASGYEKFLERLTATYAGPNFNDVFKKNGFEVHPGPRGAPENVGEELSAEHPVIRTNLVTGWKSVFAVRNLAQKINGVTDEESAHLLNWFLSLVIENHDLQVRLRWQNPNDLAIWDNRSVFHATTSDHEGFDPRTGHRAVGLGKRPRCLPLNSYLDRTRSILLRI